MSRRRLQRFDPTRPEFREYRTPYTEEDSTADNMSAASASESTESDTVDHFNMSESNRSLSQTRVERRRYDSSVHRNQGKLAACCGVLLFAGLGLTIVAGWFTIFDQVFGVVVFNTVYACTTNLPFSFYPAYTLHWAMSRQPSYMADRETSSRTSNADFPSISTTIYPPLPPSDMSPALTGHPHSPLIYHRLQTTRGGRLHILWRNWTFLDSYADRSAKAICVLALNRWPVLRAKASHLGNSFGLGRSLLGLSPDFA